MLPPEVRLPAVGKGDVRVACGLSVLARDARRADAQLVHHLEPRGGAASELAGVGVVRQGDGYNT